MDNLRCRVHEVRFSFSSSSSPELEGKTRHATRDCDEEYGCTSPHRKPCLYHLRIQDESDANEFECSLDPTNLWSLDYGLAVSIATDVGDSNYEEE